MIIAHYGHRLPGSDLEPIRVLTRERAPVWDARPELYFKAFLLREAGRFGAIASSFSSLYLWRHDGAYRDWLVSGGYRIVTDLFGRAEIEMRLALDARKGGGHEARFVITEESRHPARRGPDGGLRARDRAQPPDRGAARYGCHCCRRGYAELEIHPHPAFNARAERE